VIAGLVVYAFYGPILELLRSPLGAPLYYSSPAGSFAFIMKICFMGALIITIPIIIYNLIMFVRPAFEQALPRKRVYLTTVASAFFAIAGAIFAFYCILPGTLHFFAGFQVSGLSALISADSYLNFVTNIIITFVIVFQIPLLIVFIDSIKPLPPKKLLGLEKWVILGSLIVALLAPFTYDLVTSLLIALPIIVLYNLSIIIVVMRHARASRKERATNYAKISRPNIPSIPESTLLNNLSFEDLFDEPTTNFEQPKPIPANVSRRAGMDIRPLKSRPSSVAPVAQVYSRPKPITFSKQVRLISDFSRGPRVNHVLTSQ
jgi:sec-independent protein translocase protein TatC